MSRARGDQQTILIQARKEVLDKHSKKGIRADIRDMWSSVRNFDNTQPHQVIQGPPAPAPLQGDQPPGPALQVPAPNSDQNPGEVQPKGPRRSKRVDGKKKPERYRV
jgi:hypothetical protein